LICARAAPLLLAVLASSAAALVAYLLLARLGAWQEQLCSKPSSSQELMPLLLRAQQGSRHIPAAAGGEHSRQSLQADAGLGDAPAVLHAGIHDSDSEERDLQDDAAGCELAAYVQGDGGAGKVVITQGARAMVVQLLGDTMAEARAAAAATRVSHGDSAVAVLGCGPAQQMRLLASAAQQGVVSG
jgi:hypothetical protein